MLIKSELFNPANLVTLLGVFLGVMALSFALQSHLLIAAVCLAWASICDIYDGQVARRLPRTERQEAIGRQLDSLSDAVNYGMVPVVFLLLLGGWQYTLLLIVGAIYASATLLRLARFTVSDTVIRDGKTYFVGLPCPYIALLLPPLFLLRSVLSPFTLLVLYSVLLIVLAVLYLSGWENPKPTLKTGQRLTLLVVLYSLLCLLVTFYG